MKQPLWVVAGVVLAATGVVWTLQGFDILEGSSMSGTTTWSIAGPVTLLVGVAFIVAGLRSRKP